MNIKERIDQYYFDLIDKKDYPNLSLNDICLMFEELQSYFLDEVKSEDIEIYNKLLNMSKNDSDCSVFYMEIQQGLELYKNTKTNELYNEFRAYCSKIQLIKKYLNL